MPPDFARAQRPFEHDGFSLRPLDLHHDIPCLQRWFAMDYARFWGLQRHSVPEVRQLYAALMDSGHAMACAGTFQGELAFLLECYDPAHDQLGRHYTVRPGDVGMHFFVGPPAMPVRGFTRRVFRVLMRFMFARLHAQRVVVEPDLRNDKVHVLNREMGFAYAGTVRLPEKLAALAFCTRERFFLSQQEAHAE